jgi:hypothetical protein
VEFNYIKMGKSKKLYIMTSSLSENAKKTRKTGIRNAPKGIFVFL